MGNKRNRRSRRLETPSPERELNETQVETSTQGNNTLINTESNTQGKSADLKRNKSILKHRTKRQNRNANTDSPVPFKLKTKTVRK